jgi:hypothetical protein
VPNTRALSRVRCSKGVPGGVSYLPGKGLMFWPFFWASAWTWRCIRLISSCIQLRRMITHFGGFPLFATLFSVVYELRIATSSSVIVADCALKCKPHVIGYISGESASSISKS